MNRPALLAAAALLAGAVGGCALRPMYGGGSNGPVAAFLDGVAVQSIEGRTGSLVRSALVDRIGEPSGNDRYRLEIELDDDITGFGLRTDSAVTRERRTLRARYRLVDTGTGQVLLDATAGSDAGIDVVGSEYATLAAEQTAAERLSQVLADQIVARLGLYAARRSGR